MRDKNKIKTKIEAIFQIFILIVATIAFSYIVDKAFDLNSGVKIVSAQNTGT